MDVSDIEAGTDYLERIQSAIDRSLAMVVIIGRNWLTPDVQTGRRRLDDPEDDVRFEIMQARRANARILPVRLEGVDVPTEKELPAELSWLARRDSPALPPDMFDTELRKLVETLSDLLKS